MRFPTIKISGEDFQKPTVPNEWPGTEKKSQAEGLFSETWPGIPHDPEPLVKYWIYEKRQGMFEDYLSYQSPIVMVKPLFSMVNQPKNCWDDRIFTSVVDG